MSTLADAMHSMDMSRYPDSLTLYSPLPVSCATGLCTRTFPFPSYMFPLTCTGVPIWIVDSSPVTCLLPVSPFVLSTRTLTSSRLCLSPFVSSTRLCLPLPLMPFLLQFVDSSFVSLFMDSDSLLSHSPFLYLCTCISQTAIYMVGDGTAPHLQSTLQPP